MKYLVVQLADYSEKRLDFPGAHADEVRTLEFETIAGALVVYERFENTDYGGRRNIVAFAAGTWLSAYYGEQK